MVAQLSFPAVGWLAGWGWSAPLWLWTVFVLQFFRDPARPIPGSAKDVLSPADGRIVAIQAARDPYVDREALKISVFMNVFNVHVNRYPVSGEIEIVHYNPGEFLVASEEKASLVNEQASVGILGPRGQLLVRQIAGMVARRIVTDGNPGDTVRQGERLGMIRFGSRVDVFLEPGAAVQVQVGQKVHAGLTVLAEYAT